MKKEINWIYGIKGILALLVFIHHYFLFFYPIFSNGIYDSRSNKIFYSISHSPINILGYGGELAVSCFFVISGYLICYKYIHNKSKTLINEFIKKIIKLFIPIIISLSIYYIVLSIGLFRGPQDIINYTQHGYKSYYSNYDCDLFKFLYDGLINVFVHGNSILNPPLWTMKFELIGSFIMIIFYNITNKNNRFISYVISIYLFYNTVYLAFIIGGLICEFNQNIERKYKMRFDIKIILFIFFVYFSGYTYIVSNKYYYSWLSTLNISDMYAFTHYISAALLIFLVSNSNFLEKLLSMKIFKKIGSLSLEIYLIHWLIINTLSMWLVHILLNNLNYLYSCLIVLFITTIITILVSKILNYHLKNINGFFNSKLTKKEVIK